MISILEIKNLTKIYKNNNIEFKVFENLNFKFEENSIYALVGKSGCGKSTLSHIIHMLELPSKGTIYFNGIDICKLSDKEKISKRKDLQLVLQDGKSALDSQHKIDFLIKEPMRNLLKISTQELNKRIKNILKEFHIPESYLSKRVYELSGGEQQRICIARAFSVKPKFITLDESLSGQDPIIRKELLDNIKGFKQKNNCTILLVTHDIEIAEYIADKIILMNKESLKIKE